MIIARTIFVRFQRAGIHFYPDAAFAPELKDVEYLSHPHRHLFKFEVEIQVHHDDREIEFHQFLNWIESLYQAGTLKLNHKSCEMLGEDLISQISKKFPGRCISVSVSEDGECGARVFWEG